MQEITRGKDLGPRATKGNNLAPLIEVEIANRENALMLNNNNPTVIGLENPPTRFLSSSVTLSEANDAIVKKLMAMHNRVPAALHPQAAITPPPVVLDGLNARPSVCPFDLLGDPRLICHLFHFDWVKSGPHQGDAMCWDFVCPYPHTNSDHDFMVVRAYYPDDPTGNMFRVSNLTRHLLQYHEKTIHKWYEEHNPSGRSPCSASLLLEADVLRKTGQEKINSTRKTGGPMDAYIKPLPLNTANSILRAKELIAFAENGISFRAAGNPCFRDFLSACASAAGGDGTKLCGLGDTRTMVANAKSLSQESLPVVFGAVREVLLGPFHLEAVAFSVGFDLWTTPGLKYAFIAVSVHWTSNDFSPQEMVIDVIHIDTSHSAYHIARLIGDRIDVWILPKQFLWGNCTDNAVNVVNAAARLFAMFCESSRQSLVGVGSPTRPIRETMSTTTTTTAASPGLFDDEGPTLRDEATALLVDDMFNFRHEYINEEFDETAPHPVENIGCVAHPEALAIKDALKDTRNRDLVIAIEKMFSIIKPIRRSTAKQKMLKDILVETRGAERSFVSVVIPCDTRWSSLHDCVYQFLDLQLELRMLVASQMYDNDELTDEQKYCGKKTEFPSRSDIHLLDGLVEVLTPLKNATVFFQGADYFTLPFVPHLVSKLKLGLSPSVDTQQDTLAMTRLKESLLNAVTKRFARYLEPRHPCMLAAALHPCTSKELCEMFPPEVTTATWSELKAISIRLFGRDAPILSEENQDLLEKMGLSRDSLVEEVDKMINAMGRDLITNPISFTPKTIYVNHVAPFYKDKPTRVQQLVRAVFSLPATSATTERVFSTSGLICIPHRSRFNPCTIEMLTIVRHFIQTSTAEQRNELLIVIAKRLCTESIREFT